MTSGREVYVMQFLNEVGVPLERMARLAGGLRGWTESGRSAPPRGGHSVESAVVGSMSELLEANDLGRLVEATQGLALAELVQAFEAGGRLALLKILQEVGLALPDRQKVATAVSKAMRESCAGRDGMAGD